MTNGQRELAERGEIVGLIEGDDSPLEIFVIGDAGRDDGLNTESDWFLKSMEACGIERLHAAGTEADCQREFRKLASRANAPYETGDDTDGRFNSRIIIGEMRRRRIIVL